MTQVVSRGVSPNKRMQAARAGATWQGPLESNLHSLCPDLDSDRTRRART